MVWDFFRKKQGKQEPLGQIRLTKSEIAEQLRRACWDLYISNLPKPVIIDVEHDKNAPEVFKKEGVPSGFSIDPEKWITYFNAKDVPEFADADGAKQFCRSIGQHENMHFVHCPGSKRMNVRLVDAAMKGLSGKATYNKETAASVAHLVTNIFGDWAGDYLLGVDKFGREDFRDMTQERIRKSVEDVAKRIDEHSPLWKVLVGTYEKMFNADFGLNKYAKLDSYERDTIEKCVQIMGNDFNEKYNWPKKVQNLAKRLEDVITKSDEFSKQGKGRSQAQQGKRDGQDGVSLPEDVRRQMGPDATKSPFKIGKRGRKKGEGDNEDEKGEGSIDGEVLDEIYKLNKDNPGEFAGTLGAFVPVESDDALRLMYRARAREYLIKIREKKGIGSYGAPGTAKTWNVGDPVLGKGGLEIVPSISQAGVMVPGVTTIKRDRQIIRNEGRLKQTADLLEIIDSSGSMNWDPWQENEEHRGAFDKAIIAAEAAALYVLDHGGKVATVNFSGRDSNTGKMQITYQDFTGDIDKIEKTIMLHYNDGTIFPCETFNELMKKNNNKVVSCTISDFCVDNPSDAADVILRYTNKQNPFYLFDIGNTKQDLTDRLIGKEGIVRFSVKVMSDLKDIIIGRLKKEYE